MRSDKTAPAHHGRGTEADLSMSPECSCKVVQRLSTVCAACKSLPVGTERRPHWRFDAAPPGERTRHFANLPALRRWHSTEQRRRQTWGPIAKLDVKSLRPVGSSSVAVVIAQDPEVPGHCLARPPAPHSPEPGPAYSLAGPSHFLRAAEFQFCRRATGSAPTLPAAWPA